MPWLEKREEEPSENLLFIHVPRCGGTSLMKSHNLPQKATKAAPWYKKIGMRVFFSRYEVLEKNNFPLWTELNAIFLFIFIIGCILLQIKGVVYKVISIAMISGSFIFSMSLTYVFVAPTISRVRIVRRLFLIITEYVMCRIVSNTEYITGANRHGYLPHLTARKIIDKDYVSEEEFERVSSFAVVRNPYARMVSIYMYNRFGACESFSHFVRSWYHHTIKDYRERGEMDEWFTPCHAIPQFEYTHDLNGTKKLVRYMVKQEELKYLKKISNLDADRCNGVGTDISEKFEVNDNKLNDRNNDDNSDESSTKCTTCSSSNSGSSSGSGSVSSSEECSTERSTTKDFSSIICLPEAIRRALLGMPHDNKRRTKTPWYEYYDQETLNLTYEMYHRDFEIFGYDVAIKQRPDLEMPPQANRDDSV
mmetsp:Transcript_20148/g.50139  ORF Transcript_20148/g.50139 Transcript_20148/m.50139 type:complete len:421 (+) Transcript_20148:128-1390(+)|eukprot:CAMPEP_0116092464 /NCGR_PEP_ID=MMETSP0327-20121206/8058_1 /TAXON_ID=44447 /ORGANISM="Pseudo-nitzschia delicatissima, Strain B596" /LENGTH=420 /DNA_ID=CAMNT_0003583895 /DNA_START=120 /DNA_END=1382 /DNA_ORIENTATION=+